MISINKKKGVPKYQQIVFSIEKAIIRGVLKKGDQIPSINTIKEEHNLSRDTVLVAFNELKNRGIIQSIVGKGYYVKSENINIKKKIFLLFDELNSFKEDLYSAFINRLDENIQVDIYFHHFNFNVFKNILENSKILQNIEKYSSKFKNILENLKIFLLFALTIFTSCDLDEDAQQPGGDWAVWSKGLGISLPSNQGFHSFSHQVLALEAAATGQGIALVSDFMVEKDIREGSLVDLPVSSVYTGYDFYLCYKQARSRDQGLRAVADWLIETAASPLEV